MFFNTYFTIFSLTFSGYSTFQLFQKIKTQLSLFLVNVVAVHEFPLLTIKFNLFRLGGTLFEICKVLIVFSGRVITLITN